MTAASNRLRAAPAVACGLAGLVVFQFWGNATRGYIATNSLFHWWFYQWVNPDSETEHAWLILALSAFLFWKNLRREDGGGGSEVGKAASALLCGLLLHAIGYIAQQPRISIVALLLYAWGVLALAGGGRWGRSAAFPMAFMVFAIPVNALDTVGFWLRMWVVDAGARIAHAVGIGVIRSGTQLLAPDGRYQYDVVAACSGIRSLMALAALSLFIGYLWFRPAWLRGAMLLLSLPLVYLGNVLRISSIIVAAQWGGQAWGDRVHDVMGFGVFIIVVGGIAAVADAIARGNPRWTGELAGRAPAASADGRRGPGTSVVAAAVVMAAVAEAAFLGYRSSLPPDGRAGVILAADGANPAELPAFPGSDWMGSSVEPTAIERAILPPDTGYSTKQYVSREGANRQVLVSIVLSGRDRTSIHRPELCLVAQGWTVDGSSSHRFSYPGRPGADFDATVLHVRRERGGKAVPELVAYWFVGSDRIVPSQGARMLHDSWNRLVHGRADRWAYVLLMTGADDGEGAGLARIQSILDSTLASFQPPLAPERGGGGG
jgi:exosortase